MNAMTPPTGNAAVVFLAEALGRLRALDEFESRMLQRAMVRDTGSFRRWTPGEDARLMKMRKAGIKAAAMAVTLNRTVDSVYTRIRELKKARRVRR